MRGPMAGSSRLLLTGNKLRGEHVTVAVNAKSSSYCIHLMLGHCRLQFTVQRSYAGQTLFISFQVLALVH